MQFNQKKILFYIFSILLVCCLLFLLVGCKSNKINVISRDAASGTRTTFDSTIGIDGVRKDASYLNANGIILSCINRDRRAIGYVAKKSYEESRSSMKNVKSIQLDGKDADSPDYDLGHTLYLIYKIDVVEKNKTLKNFMSFVISKEAQEIIEAEKYTLPNIPTSVENFKKPTTQLTDAVIIGGSTTTEPLMQKLREKYLSLVGEKFSGKIEIQGGGSSKGINDVKSEQFQLGMSSRPLNASEKQGVEVYNLATENIVIVVNSKNPIDNLTKSEVKAIYEGKIREWTEI